MKRPWSAAVRVQPAQLELTERPGSAPPREQPLLEETTFSNPAATEPPSSRVTSPVAWGDDQGHSAQDGTEFVNKAALEADSEVRGITGESNIQEPGSESNNEITRSHTPVRAAWESDQERTPSRRSSTVSVKSKTGSFEGIQSLHPQAYIPYNVAKRNISKVITDMKLMREDHKVALTELGSIYKEIESETQVRYLIVILFLNFPLKLFSIKFLISRLFDLLSNQKNV